MIKSNKQIRKELGYDTDEECSSNDDHQPNIVIPGSYFAFSAITIFVLGIIGMATELDGKDMNYLLLYFAMSFFIAPAILVYPVIRLLLGEEKTGFSAFISTLFGYYIQSSIKKRMDKW